MDREEKNILTKEKIIESARSEFGEKNYLEASINSICKRGSLSKGIVYHYFKNKDELYLYCVKDCFENLEGVLKRLKIEENSLEANIKQYMDVRHRFFIDNPYFINVFVNTLLAMPKHLVEEIEEIKINFDRFNIAYYESILRGMELKKDICLEDAVEYFIMFQESFNSFYRGKGLDNLDELFLEHEVKMDKILRIMLYGIVEEELR